MEEEKIKPFLYFINFLPLGRRILNLVKIKTPIKNFIEE